MEGLLDESLAERRFNTLLLGALAAISLTLAMIGVYGVISYAVTQRTREFGIRMALGAVGPDLLRIVLAGAARMVAIGALIGLALAIALTKLLSGLLFGVSSRDPLTFAVTALLLLIVALLATLVPARRATKVDPMVALRYE
jgi:ABC-type antimicrobial peptide transport system permease subunit